MTENQFENNSVKNIQIKIKSLVALLSEIKESSHNNEFDASICNDIYTYIQIIQNDCQRIEDYNLFSNKDYTIQNIYGSTFFITITNNK
jgi:hypothetical protein